MTKRRQSEWMAYVKAGDVLQTPSGDLRMVRKTKRYEDGELRSATFAIRRCSWTGRAYTVKGYAEMHDWTFLLAHELPDDRLTKKLARNLRYSKRFSQNMTCCDARGMP